MAEVERETAGSRRRPVALWLLACCLVVAAIVVVGGITRLTGSGLSIVVWEPIMGVIPPLSQEDWEDAFAQYRQFPEYQLKNLGMSLEEFKWIFWWEYLHRLLGRLIGVVFLIPFLVFLYRGLVDRPLVPRLVALFILGGLQGALGWYMVTSGLVDDPQVSQYRLTAHLGLAFLIYGYMFWLALGLLHPRTPPSGIPSGVPYRFALLVLGLVFLTVLSGGFVAGTRAGLIYNTFPLMGGQWIPYGVLGMEPFYVNFFENMVTIQFTHRLLAVLVFFSVIGLSIVILARPAAGPARLASHLLLGAMLLQVTLGILTLLKQVPIPLAVAHQAGGLLLFTAATYLVHALRLRGDPTAAFPAPPVDRG